MSRLLGTRVTVGIAIVLLGVVVLAVDARRRRGQPPLPAILGTLAWLHDTHGLERAGKP